MTPPQLINYRHGDCALSRDQQIDSSQLAVSFRKPHTLAAYQQTVLQGVCYDPTSPMPVAGAGHGSRRSGAVQIVKLMTKRWEHFEHGADIGVRGFGSTKAEAYEQAWDPLESTCRHASLSIL